MNSRVRWILFAAGGLALVLWRAGGERASTTRSETVARPAASDPPVPESTAPPPARAAPAARVALEPEAVDPRKPEPLVTVRVRSVVHFGKDAAAVPEIAFQIIAARESTTARTQPDLWSRFPPVPITPADPPIAAGRTDARGEALLDLDRSQVRADPDGLPLVCVRVVEPGYQQQVFFGRAAKDEPGVLEVLIQARRGATARGRVVDVRGAPVDAEVRLCRWMKGVRNRLEPGRRARLLAGGWFELHFDEAIVGGHVLAEAGDLGTGCARDLDLSLDAPPQDLRVVVRGEGAVRGRIVDASGAPAAGLDVLVMLAELDDERGSSVPPEPAASLRRLEGAGQLWVMTRTDPTGKFTALGLRPEPCVVRARIGQTWGAYPLLLTSLPVEADGAELALRVARPTLVVRLLDVDGRTWSSLAAENPAFASLGRLGSRFAGSTTDWPVKPTVSVFPCVVEDGQPCIVGDRLEGRPLDTGDGVFEVQEGARYLVSARGPGFDGIPREVEVPPGSGPVVVELRARDLGELGTITVRVVHAGSELTGGYGGEPFGLRLETFSPVTLLALHDTEQSSASFVFRAPAGTYRVVAEGRTATEFHHGTVTRRRALGRSEAEVVLRAGAREEVLLDLAEGARLEVTLVGEVTEADVAAARAANPWLADRMTDVVAAEAEVARRAALAELHLVEPGRPREPVLRVDLAYSGSSAAGQHLLTQWPLGETRVSEVLPCGRHSLVARLPGGRTARAEVELVSGTTAKVTLRF